MAINYDIPMLFNAKYIEGLQRLLHISEDRIKSVYGSIQKSILGQARYSNKIPQISNDELQNYIIKIHELGIKFHYTINSPWTNLIERSEKNRDIIKNEIEHLLYMGVDALIIANPYLMSLVKGSFPEAKIIGSINFQTSTAYKFKKLLEDGCGSIVLDRVVNRNIKFLKQIQEFSNNFSLLVNSTCLLDCPLQQYHANENGYLSSIFNEKIYDKNYCINYCLSEIETNPINILKSTWIRPEDISRYKQVGVENFKIQGRTLDAETLLSIIKAYLTRKIPNNKLFFIFPEFDEKYQKLNMKFLNSSLDRLNFIKFFFDTEKNCTIDCLHCNHCEKTFNKL